MTQDIEVGAGGDSIPAAFAKVNVLMRRVTNPQTANYVFVVTDAQQLVRQTVTTTANTVTVPLNATGGFTEGDVVTVVMYGTGVTTLVAAPGVTINTRVGLVLARYGVAFLRYMGGDVWLAWGDLSA
jgi:hypothetical protein